MPRSNNGSDGKSRGALLFPNRRNLLKTLGIGGAAAIAGCTDGGGGETTTTTEETTTSSGGGGDDDETTTTTTEEQQATVTGQYTTAYSSAASTLNFIYNTEAGAAARIGLTMDGAWAITTENEVFPLWIEPSTEDAKTWTMKVRDGLQWGGDYGKMTAEDWVYMIKNVFQGKDNWAAYPNYSEWQGKEVEKTGEMEFTITLPSKDPAFTKRPVMWGQFCAPKGLLKPYVEEKDAKGLENSEELSNLKYTGNLGPYNKDTWEKSSKFVGTRNENYYMHDRDDVSELWQGAPYYEKFVQRVVPEQSSRLQALKNGEVASASIPPNRAEEFKRNDDIDVYVQPQPYVRPLIWNMRANGWEPTRNRKVRQAFMLALDKETFNRNVFRGYAKPAYTMQPKWSKWYPEGDAISDYEFGTGDQYSAETARQRMKEGLDEGGYDYSYDGDTLVNPDGEATKLTIMYQSGQPTEQTMAESLNQNFKNNLGIELELKSVQGSTFVRNYAYNSVSEDKKDQVPDDWSTSPFNKGPRDVATSSKAWDMGLIYGFNTYPRTPADSKTFFTRDGGINYYGYVPSDGVDIGAKYDEARTTVDEAKRKQLLGEAFKLIAKEQPFGFLAMSDDIVGYQKNVVGPVEKFGSGWDSNTYYRKE